MASVWRPFALPMAVLVLVLAGCAGGTETGEGQGREALSSTEVAGDSACVLSMLYEGARYDSAPEGAPERSPVLTGRTATAVLPDCDDGGGEDPGPEDVRVEQIEGVPLDTAFWWQGSIMVRAGARLPRFLEPLYQRPECRFPGQVVVSGQWLGVTTTRQVRFDGDLRPPLRIELQVEGVDDPIVDLERYTIRVRDDGSARPALDKDMAEQALWSNRSALRVTLTCDGGKFRATSFGVIPR